MKTIVLRTCTGNCGSVHHRTGGENGEHVHWPTLVQVERRVDGTIVASVPDELVLADGRIDVKRVERDYPWYFVQPPGSPFKGDRGPLAEQV